MKIRVQPDDQWNNNHRHLLKLWTHVYQGLPKDIIMKSNIHAAAILIAIMGLSACNTVAGAGRDVSSVGHETTKAADGAK